MASSTLVPNARDRDLSLYLRAYWPKSPVIDGWWTPRAVERQR